MEIPNGQPSQNSSQNSVLWRGAECHCQVTEFLPHKYKKIMKSKLKASNTLLNSAKNAVRRREHFCFHAETSGQQQ
jgi:hypothetical protein